MKPTFLLFFLVIFLGCQDDELSKQCPTNFDLGLVDIPSLYFDFIPYEGEEVLTFSNEMGEEITFLPQTNTRGIKESVWKMKCAFDSNDSINIELAYDQRVVTFCTSENWCIDARTSIIGVYGYCFDIESDENFGFLRWSTISLSRNSNVSLSTGVSQQSWLNEEVMELSKYDLDALEVNGEVYDNVYINNNLKAIHFSNVTIAEGVGIIQFEDQRNQIWSLKK